MKYLLVFFFLLFGTHAIDAQTKRALIIGIGAYPPESGWSIIHGDNDVPLIDKHPFIQTALDRVPIRACLLTL